MPTELHYPRLHLDFYDNYCLPRSSHPVRVQGTLVSEGDDILLCSGANKGTIGV